MIERENWPRDNTLPENNQALLKGFRYSSEAIRQLAWEIVSKDRITAESIGLNPHPSPLVINDLSFQRDFTIASYLYLVGFIGPGEFKKMSTYVGSKNRDIVETKWDSTNLFVKADEKYTFGNTPSPIQVRNIIRPSFRKVAEDINFIRSKKDVAVVLVHGKWNGFPHTGYFQMYIETMSELENYGIKEDKIIFVLAGDTNKDIKLFGHNPFLNTLWRLSMNSYIPCDFLCSSGDFDSINDADNHWVNNYKSLQPDFIHFDGKDPLISHKLKRIKKLRPKITPIIRTRFNEGDDLFVSQTNLRTFSAGIFTVKAQLEDAMIEQHYFDRKSNWKKFLQENGKL